MHWMQTNCISSRQSDNLHLISKHKRSEFIPLRNLLRVIDNSVIDVFVSAAHSLFIFVFNFNQ